MVKRVAFQPRLDVPLLEFGDGQSTTVATQIVEPGRGIITVTLADRMIGKPRWQYWRYSEQTLRKLTGNQEDGILRHGARLAMIRLAEWAIRHRATPSTPTASEKGKSNTMSFQATSVGGGASTDLLGHFLHRIATLILVACAVGLSIWPSNSAQSADNRRAPNVIIILADDIGYGDFGCYGATKVKTPNVDRFASQGLRFTDAHSMASVCTPSRYSFMTGQYAFRNARTAGRKTGQAMPRISG